MKTIEEIQSELRAIAQELEDLKESKMTDDITTDFRQISANASYYPIVSHPLKNFDEYTKKCYITLLLTVTHFDSDSFSHSLTLAHRIAFGSEYLCRNEDLKEEFIASQIITFEQLDEITSLFNKIDERLIFILDCLLTAGAFNKNRNSAMEYIAQLAAMLKIKKDELVFLSNMAAVILTDDLNNYKCDIANKYEIFNCYLEKLKFKRSILKADIPKSAKGTLYATVGVKYIDHDFSLCKNVNKKNKSIIYDCRYGDVFDGSGTTFFFPGRGTSETIKQHIDDYFFLFEKKAENIKPGSPVGVITHPLDTPDMAIKFFNYIKKNEQNKENEEK